MTRTDHQHQLKRRCALVTILIVGMGLATKPQASAAPLSPSLITCSTVRVRWWTSQCTSLPMTKVPGFTRRMNRSPRASSRSHPLLRQRLGEHFLIHSCRHSEIPSCTLPRQRLPLHAVLRLPRTGLGTDSAEGPAFLLDLHALLLLSK